MYDSDFGDLGADVVAMENAAEFIGQMRDDARRPTEARARKLGRPAGEVTCHGCGTTWEANCWRRRGMFHDCAALPQAALAA